jgi:hypothetical protein
MDANLPPAAVAVTAAPTVTRGGNGGDGRSVAPPRRTPPWGAPTVSASLARTEDTTVVKHASRRVTGRVAALPVTAAPYIGTGRGLKVVPPGTRGGSQAARLVTKARGGPRLGRRAPAALSTEQYSVSASATVSDLREVLKMQFGDEISTKHDDLWRELTLAKGLKVLIVLARLFAL